MTGFERLSNILQRKPVDRIGLYESFWGDTRKAWAAAGHVREDEDLGEHFGFDLVNLWAFNYVADLDFVPVTVAEDEDTITKRDGNGAILKQHKKHNATPEHVAFTVQCRADWEKLIKPHLVKPDPRRINFQGYRDWKAKAKAKGRFFCWSGVNVFEQMHPIIGHETMLMAMIDDPDWVTDMCTTLANVNLMHQEILFKQEGLPDGVWFYEDMGFKERPFMSPDMYQTFIQPAHTKTIRYAKDHKLPVIMHSCGFIEPLLPGMVEAGIDCLQVIEVKAGMDLLRIHKNFGHRLALMGGMDVRKLYTNDLAQVDAELESKIPFVKKGFGYALHSDHSIPNTVNYETYRHFIDRGLELGKY